jgi:hypothetical protein
VKDRQRTVVSISGSHSQRPSTFCLRDVEMFWPSRENGEAVLELGVLALRSCEADVRIIEEAKRDPND